MIRNDIKSNYVIRQDNHVAQRSLSDQRVMGGLGDQIRKVWWMGKR